MLCCFLCLRAWTNSDSFCSFLCIRAWAIQIHSVVFFVSELGQFRFIPVRRSVDSEWVEAKEQCNAQKNDSIAHLLNGYIAFDFIEREETSGASRNNLECRWNVLERLREAVEEQ
jgi:hypothetical protein